MSTLYKNLMQVGFYVTHLFTVVVLPKDDKELPEENLG